MATKDRTALKNDFANGKYATGEKFADLIDSMKVVQLPVVDPQALGTSLSFIDSISQDADGKITATKKTLDLSNAHELNPFKGWYKTGDTLPTDGFDGAYLYFKDTSELTGQTTIYRWNGTTYADTGTVVDTSNVHTFESGQALNGVKIKNEDGEDVSGIADVLSAAAGKELNQRFILSDVINPSDFEAKTIHIIYDTNSSLYNKWGGGSGSSMRRFPVEVGEHYKITANSENNAYYAFLTQYAYTSGQTPAYVTNTGLNIVPAGTSEDILIPETCLYLYVDYSGTPLPNVAPQSLEKISLINLKDLSENVSELNDTKYILVNGEIKKLTNEDWTTTEGKYIMSDGRVGTNTGYNLLDIPLVYGDKLRVVVSTKIANDYCQLGVKESDVRYTPVIVKTASNDPYTQLPQTNYYYVEYTATSSCIVGVPIRNGSSYINELYRTSLGTIDKVSHLESEVSSIINTMNSEVINHSLIKKARETYMNVEYINHNYGYTRSGEWWKGESGDKDNCVIIATPIDQEATSRTLEYIDNYKWSLPSGSSFVGQFDDAKSISLDLSSESYEIRNLIPNKLYLWRVKDNNDKILSSGIFRTSGNPRIVQIESQDVSDTDGLIHNTRDIGGWATETNKHIRYGVIYRGYELNHKNLEDNTVTDRISSAGIQTAKGILGISAELDLRTTEEAPGYSALGQDVGYANFQVDLLFFRLNIYFNIVNNLTLFANAIRYVMQWAKEEKGIYVHCTGGCDRTGFLIAAIEGIVGVSENDINKDYEFSERYRDRELYLVGQKRVVRNNVVIDAYDGDFKFAIDYIKNLVEYNGQYYVKSVGYNDTLITIDSTQYSRGSIVYGGTDDMEILYYSWISEVDNSDVCYTTDRYPDENSDVYTYDNVNYTLDSNKVVSAMVNRFWYPAINTGAVGNSPATPSKITDQALIANLEAANIGSFKERWHRLMNIGGMTEREMEELEDLICV